MGSRSLPCLHQGVSVVRRAIFIAVLILSALLTGCSENPAPQPDEPIVSTPASSEPVEETPVAAEPCARECSGDEVNTNPCGLKPSTIGRPIEVQLGKVSG